MNPISFYPQKSPLYNGSMTQGNALVESRFVRRREVASAGFSLVEVMVAIAIGMLGIIVMMNVFSMFEGQKRTTTGGDDAISSGAVSLYGLQRNIQQSGWGFNAKEILGCSVTGLTSGGGALPLVPVTINSALITGHDDNTDTLLLVTGSSNGTVEGDVINSTAGAVYSVHTPAAFAAGDQVVAVSQVWPATCNLTRTSVSSIDVPAGTVTLGTVAAFAVASQDRLFNLGAAPTVRAYAVRDGNLTVCNYNTSNCAAVASNGNPDVWVPIANNVVSLRAQYGHDTTVAPMDGVVDVWNQTVPTTACGFVRASALRIALVARSSQPEKRLDGNLTGTAYVTPAAPLWAGSDAVSVGIDATEAGLVAVNLSQSIFPVPTVWPQWQDYRYKVFQTTVPLRNITTLGAVSGC